MPYFSGSVRLVPHLQLYLIPSHISTQHVTYTFSINELFFKRTVVCILFGLWPIKTKPYLSNLITGLWSVRPKSVFSFSFIWILWEVWTCKKWERSLKNKLYCAAKICFFIPSLPVDHLVTCPIPFGQVMTRDLLSRPPSSSVVLVTMLIN